MAILWKDMSHRRPLVYGMAHDSWEQRWIVYLDQEEPPVSSGHVVRASMIASADVATGDVGYVGSASDEGEMECHG